MNLYKITPSKKRNRRSINFLLDNSRNNSTNNYQNKNANACQIQFSDVGGGCGGGSSGNLGSLGFGGFGGGVYSTTSSPLHTRNVCVSGSFVEDIVSIESRFDISTVSDYSPIIF